MSARAAPPVPKSIPVEVTAAGDYQASGVELTTDDEQWDRLRRNEPAWLPVSVRTAVDRVSTAPAGEIMPARGTV